MIKRIIFGIICAVLGIGLIFLRDTPVLTVALMAMCGMATHELNHAVKLQNKPIMVVSIIASVLCPVYYEYGSLLQATGLNMKGEYIICLYILLICIFMLFEYEKTKFSHVATVVISSLGIPFAFTRFMYFRDIDEYFPERGYNTSHGVFLILFVLFSALLTDVFAYFVGSFFGKHKLCPNISPNKTIEGAIGGVVGCVISNIVLYAVFENFVFAECSHNYVGVVLMTVAMSIISMCGDLTASVIKRNFGIKDFSKLIPGHGGIIDRLDSSIFVLVALYAVFNIFGVAI